MRRDLSADPRHWLRCRNGHGSGDHVGHTNQC
jgi:hypothetical protein